MFFKINYNINGKDFDCVVKSDQDGKYWTVAYVSPSNPKNDCWVRRETASPHLFKFKKDITEQEFNNVFEQVYVTCKYN